MSTQTNKTGVSFLGLLAILFIGLKLTSVIDWSWWLVLLPLYAPICITAIVLLIYITVKVKEVKPKKKNRFQEKMLEMMEKAEQQKKNKS